VPSAELAPVFVSGRRLIADGEGSDYRGMIRSGRPRGCGGGDFGFHARIPMTSRPSASALLLIDVQQGFDDLSYWGARNNPGAEANMARLLSAWRTARRPVIHVKHNSRNPRSPLHPANAGNAIKAALAPLPGEPTLEKEVNSSFIGTDLETRLRQAGITGLVIVGLTTPHCVSTTTRMAANLGFKVRLVSDATAAFDWKAHDERTIPAEEMHYQALAPLHGEFADVVTTEVVLATAIPA
jgi:nicotinamidase-related amidase